MVEKNERKERAKKHRNMSGFNTGERIFKNPKDYKRKKRWSEEDGQ